MCHAIDDQCSSILKNSNNLHRNGTIWNMKYFCHFKNFIHLSKLFDNYASQKLIQKSRRKTNRQALITFSKLLQIYSVCKFNRIDFNALPSIDASSNHRRIFVLFSFLLIKLNFPKTAQYETRLITFILCTLQVEFAQIDTLPPRYDSLPQIPIMLTLSSPLSIACYSTGSVKRIAYCREEQRRSMPSCSIHSVRGVILTRTRHSLLR